MSMLALGCGVATETAQTETGRTDIGRVETDPSQGPLAKGRPSLDRHVADADDSFNDVSGLAASSPLAAAGSDPTSLVPPALSELPPVPRHWDETPDSTRRVTSFTSSGDELRLSFGGFQHESDRDLQSQATRLVATPQQTGPTSDGGPDGDSVEVIQTPRAQLEARGELVPTPEGTPERDATMVAPTVPMARVARDADPGKSNSPSTVAKRTLIDPSTDPGLVGGQAGPEDYQQWPQPDVVLFVTGDQHGYIEPCGCTGLENQKGGVARRFTFMDQLRSKGWDLVPIDGGNQIRRIGPQAAIKFEKSSQALKQMKYKAVGFGPADMRLSATDLISVAYAETPEDGMFVSGNVVLIDPSFVPSHKLIRKGDWAVGVTSILDPDALEARVEEEVVVGPIKESAAKVLKEMNAAGATYRVLTFFGSEDTAKQLMVDVPGYDLIVVSSGYGEPTYRPQSIEGSDTKLIVTGHKGMFAGLVGLYDDRPLRYARVPLTHEFKDAPEMRRLMAEYQQQLEQLGLSGLGISPIPHPSGEKFVGTKTCGKCHTTAMDVWEGSQHALATEHIVKPPKERGDIARHFDPECLSCHVTGWNPQHYQPYETGYLSLEKSPHLLGNGCENCHGPGASHAAAEEENSGVSEERKKSLRLAMQLPLDRAKEHCMKCHDLDNSPDFHDEDAFEDVYWPEIEHYGTD
ncbi:cytochrome C554 [Roseiconus nitratireducens]|uniref:Cytochrome C554 n=1 Tax=Roseiconus nitratireducens TaxID=2605748 RepID=A0A5M6CZ64_9BACT|nr:multiheme c-type cytochrome [Roseiconus nitratireducens]KAA5539302.1 cytochrome C554 [Roseiconus nitratireducens]